MYVIEDELHSELIGEFPDKEAAVAELRRLAALPWDQAPNQAPCTSWRTCGRDYVLVEYDGSSALARPISRTPALEVSSEGSRLLV